MDSAAIYFFWTCFSNVFWMNNYSKLKNLQNESPRGLWKVAVMITLSKNYQGKNPWIKVEDLQPKMSQSDKYFGKF